MTKPSWITKLRLRWGVTTKQVFIILLVFALTGTTVAYLKFPIRSLIFPDGGTPWYYYVLYYILILPVYNVLLLAYVALFGQFAFFWNFEKRFFNRMIGRKEV